MPPKQYFQNAYSCQQHSEFIATYRHDSLWGAQLLGRVGQSQPPGIVMHLTMEPSKPRLCHDE